MAPGMVIVGAGECGTRAALALREAGYDGPVTLIGAEPHPPYERPPLSKDAITAETPGAEADRRRRAARRGRHRLPPLPHRHRDRPRRAAASAAPTATTLAYDRLLLATGARPRPLPLPGADGPTVATLRTLEDAARIRAALGPGRRLAVIGGGFIGLELAASARKLGAEVAVIEALPRLLTRGVPAEIAAVLQARHVAEGVSFHFGARIAAITADGRRACPTAPRIPADLVDRRHRRGAEHRARRRGRARRRERRRRRRDPRHLRPRGLRRRRLLLVPAAALRRPPRAPRELAQRPGAGHARRAQHARRRRAGLGGALVLVRPVRPLAADRRPRRRRDDHDPPRRCATAPSSSSTSPPTGGCWPRAASAPATPSPRTSASPR